MSEQYSLTAQLQFRADNLQQTVDAINAKLRDIKATVRLELPQQISTQLNQINQSIQSTIGNLQKLQAETAKVGSATSAMATSFQRVQGGAAAASAGLSQVATSAQKTTVAFKESYNVAEQFGRLVAVAARRFAAFTVGAGAIIGLGLAFKNSLKEAIAFDEGLNKLQQIGGLTSTQLTGLERQISSLSQTFGASSRELLQQTVTLRKLGLSYQETGEALSTLAKIAHNPNFDGVKNQATSLVTVMTQFKLSAGDAEQALNKLIGTGNAYGVETKDLLTGVERAGAAFRNTGGSIQQFAALFTSIKATTRESTEGIASGLRSLFARLQSPESIAGLQALGVNLRNNQGQFVGTFEAIKKLSEFLRTIPPSDPRFGAIVEQLGGFRKLNTILPLLQDFRRSQEALNVATYGSVTVSAAAQTSQQALATQIRNTKESFLELGRTLLNTTGFQATIKSVLFMAETFNTLAKAIAPLLPLLAGLGAFKLLSNFSATGFASGVQQTLTKGALPRRFAGGGVVPGHGSGDTVPAMLEPGEFVVRKQSAQQIGYGNLEHLTRGGSITPRGFTAAYAQGGSISPVNFGLLAERAVVSRPSSAFLFNDVLRNPKLLSQIPEGATFLGSGAQALVFRLPNGNVLRVAKATQQGSQLINPRPNTSLVLQPLSQKIVGDTLFEELPYAPSLNNLIAQGRLNTQRGLSIGQRFTQNIERRGLVPTDVNGDNIGLLGNRPVAIDPEVFITRQQALREGVSTATGAPFELYAGGGYVAALRRLLQRGVRAADRAYLGAEPLLEKYAIAKGYDPYAVKTAGYYGYSAIRNPIQKLFGFAAGGSTSDTVPAMLTPGEFVINKSAADTIGRSKLDYMNKFGRVPGYARGGVVRMAEGGNLSPFTADESALNSVKGLKDTIFKDIERTLVNSGQASTERQLNFRDQIRTIRDTPTASQYISNASLQYQKQIGGEIAGAGHEQAIVGQEYTKLQKELNTTVRQQIKAISPLISNTELHAATEKTVASLLQDESRLFKQSGRVGSADLANQLIQRDQSPLGRQFKSPILRGLRNHAGLAVLGAAAGLGLAASSLAPSESAEDYVRSGSADSFRARKVGSSTLQGAATFATGAFFFSSGNPLIVGLAAAAGALISFTSAVKESSKEINQAKLTVAITNLDRVLSSVTRGELPASGDNLQNIASNISEVLHSIDAQARDKATGFFGGFDVKNFNTFRKEQLNQSLGGALPGVVRLLNQQAAEAGKGTVPTDQATKQFTDINKQFISLLSQTSGRSFTDTAKDFTKLITDTRKQQEEDKKTNEANNAIAQLYTSFVRLTQAVDIATVSTEKFAPALQTTQNFLLHSDTAVKFTGLAGLSTLGGPGNVNFQPALRLLTSGLGPGGQQLERQATFTNRIGQILPGILAEQRSTPLNSEGKQDISTGVTNALKKALGDSPEAQKAIAPVTQFFASKDARKIFEQSQNDLSQVAKQANSQNSRAVEQVLQKLGGDFTRQINETAQHFTSLNRIILETTQEFGRLQDITLELQRAQAEVQAERLGGGRGAGIQFLSLEQLQQPFTARVQNLAGAGQPTDAASLGRALNVALQRQQVAQANAQVAGPQGAFQAQQQVQAANLRVNQLTDALKLVASPTQKLAAINEKLADVLNRQQTQRNFTQGLITGGPEAQLKFAQTAQFLPLVARGGINAVTPDIAQNIFSLLDAQHPQQLLSARVTGKQGVTVEQFKNQLIDSGGRNAVFGGQGIFEGLAKDVGDKNNLQQQLIKAYQDATEAQQQILRVRGQQEQQLVQQLRFTFDTFVSRLQASLLDAREFDLKQRQGGLNDRVAKQQDILNQQKFLAGFNVTPENFGNVRAQRGNIEAFLGATASIDQRNAGVIGPNGALNRIKEISDKDIDALITPKRHGTSVDIDRNKSLELFSRLGLTPDIAANVYNDLQATGQIAGKITGVNPTVRARGFRKEFERAAQQQLDVSNQADVDKLLAARGQLQQIPDLNVGAVQGLAGNEQQRKQFLSALDTSPDAFKNAAKELASLNKQLDDFAAELKKVQGQIGEAKKQEQAALKGQVNIVGGAVAKGFLNAGFAEGGSVFQPRGTDTVPAMLTPGEFVVKREAAQQNRSLLERINRGSGGVPQYYEKGGSVIDPRKLTYEEFLGLTDADLAKIRDVDLDPRLFPSLPFNTRRNQEHDRRDYLIKDNILAEKARRIRARLEQDQESRREQSLGYLLRKRYQNILPKDIGRTGDDRTITDNQLDLLLRGVGGISDFYKYIHSGKFAYEQYERERAAKKQPARAGTYKEVEDKLDRAHRLAREAIDGKAVAVPAQPINPRGLFVGPPAPPQQNSEVQETLNRLRNKNGSDLGVRGIVATRPSPFIGPPAPSAIGLEVQAALQRLRTEEGSDLGVGSTATAFFSPEQEKARREYLLRRQARAIARNNQLVDFVDRGGAAAIQNPGGFAALQGAKTPEQVYAISAGAQANNLYFRQLLSQQTIGGALAGEQRALTVNSLGLQAGSNQERANLLFNQRQTEAIGRQNAILDRLRDRQHERDIARTLIRNPENPNELAPEEIERRQRLNRRALRGFAAGGYVPGAGNSDSVPALLTPGEYVLNKQQVQRFAAGGLVTSDNSSLSQSASPTNNALADALTAFNSRAQALADAFNKLGAIQIQGSFSHKVEVIINGAEVLSKLQPAIQDLIVSKTQSIISDTFRKNLPDVGPLNFDATAGSSQAGPQQAGRS